jgi:hypothetical protein
MFGTRLTSELTLRVHHVTAIARHPEKLQGQAAVSPVSGDVQNEKSLATVLAGHDAVIHSVKFLSTNASKIIAATKAAKVPRLLVVGGAGSLEVTPGLTLVNTPDFPAEYKLETLAGVEFLNVLRGEKELDWTFLSPSYLFAPGERTGKFRILSTHVYACRISWSFPEPKSNTAAVFLRPARGSAGSRNHRASRIRSVRPLD